MITRDQLTDYLHQHLSCATFNDYAPNGLQVEGRLNIERICTAVTASQAAIEHAVHLKADALFVHHGYFWRGESSVITGMKRSRIGTLIRNDINLYAYHLPLDCHPILGNNAQLAQRLNAMHIKKHTVGNVENLLWSGTLACPQAATELLAHLTQQLQREPVFISGHERAVRNIAWCTGGAQDYIEHAAQLGMDAYISGEASERTYYQAKELGIHYFACGHHATERYGVQALGQHLAEHFNLQHHFIDSDNPI